MTEPLIQSVADTAFLVAAFRAIESERPDALFRDPLATRLAGERGLAMARQTRAHFFGGWTLVVRTAVIDDLIRDAIASGVDTVVNLGAGLDTRPYRMELPASLHWIEVDRPQVLAWKEEQLATEQPRCQLERLELDLEDASARQAFLDATCALERTVLILAEGVLPYLDNAHVAALADELRGKDSVRDWIVDYFSPQAMRFRKRGGRGHAMRHAEFRFKPGDWHRFFLDHGWQVHEMHYLLEEGERRGRPFPATLTMKFLANTLGLLAGRKRRQAMRRFAGYALLRSGARVGPGVGIEAGARAPP